MRFSRIFSAFVVACVMCWAGAARAANSVPAPLDLFHRAQIEAAAGHNDAALQDLLAALKADPNNTDMQKLLGDVYYRLQNYKAAEAAYKALLARDPNNKDLHNRLGGVYAAEDRFDDAVAQFRASLPSAEGFSNLIEAYADEGRLGELEAEYQLEISRNQFDPVAHYNYGTVLSREERYSEAISQFTQAIAMQPHFVDAHNALGKAYGDQGHYTEAINEYKIALGLNPKYYMSMMNWGVELIYQANYAGAMDKINQAIAMNPLFAKSYINLGVAYEDTGQFTQAVEDYQHAINLDPREWTGFIDLAAIYMNHGLPNLAEAACVKGLAVNPHVADLHYLLGHVYQMEKKFSLAKAQYDVAIAEKPNDPAIKQSLTEVENALSHPH